MRLVLSLEKDIKRRQAFFSQNGSTGFEVFSAIDAKTRQDEILKIFNTKKAEQIYHRELTIGEMACTLSHIKMYEHFLKNSTDDYLIICEDDALFGDNFIIDEIILNLKAKLKNCGVIIFGESKIPTHDFKRVLRPMQFFPFSFKGYVIGKLSNDTTIGTVGYAISKQACEFILRKDEVFWLADDFYTVLEKKFKIYNVMPRMVIENLNFKSNLEVERVIKQSNTKLKTKENTKIPLIKKIRHKIFKETHRTKFKVFMKKLKALLR